MDKNLRSEKLVQYLDGELPGHEKLAIEQELAADIAFSKEYENLKLARSAIRFHGLQKKVSGIHAEMMKELKTPARMPLGRKIRYSVAVAASLVLLVGAYLIYNFVTLASEKIFGSRYQPYEMTRFRDNETKLTALDSAYQEKDYKKVLSLKKTAKDLSTREEFLAGAAALELKDNVKAIESFKTVRQKNKKLNKTDFNDEADYYLALAYIRNKDYDLALDELKLIHSSPEHLYNEKITPKLLRQVRMLKWR